MDRPDHTPVPDPPDAGTGARGFWRELGRRHVLRTAALYVGGSAALLQGADIFQQALSLPEGTVRVLGVVAVCGLPVALALSWAYDIKTDGRDSRGGWRRHGVVLTVALLALVAAGVWLARGSRSGPAPVAADPMPLNRVAILALDAPGATPEGSAFATYLQERLIEGLSAAGAASNVADSTRLRVISRAGTLPYSGGTFTTDSIGRALRAGTLVSGLVEYADTRVRVRLQLIDAASAEVLATSQIEAESAEAVRLVDAVADSLGRMVRQGLGRVIAERSVRLGTQSEEAFKEFLLAEFWKKDVEEALELDDLDRGLRGLQAADQALAGAEEQDPRWVEPVTNRAMLAYHVARLAQARGERDLAAYYEEGLGHAERAVGMAPRHPQSRLARGALRATLAQGRPPDAVTEALQRGAEEDLRVAVATGAQPADALRRLSELYASQGRLEEALAYGRRAYDEDPYLSDADRTLLRLFESSIRLGRDREAADWCAAGESRFPAVTFFADCRLLLMAWTAEEPTDPDTAWALVARELSPYPASLRPLLEPRLQALVAAVLARAGEPDSARSVLARAIQQDRGTPGVHMVAAGVESLLGDRDKAMAHVARVLELSPGQRTKLAGAPELRGLRDVQEFRALAGLR